MIRLSAVVALVMIGSMSHAADDALSRYKNYLPAQILALSEEERKNSVPMVYSGAASMAVTPAGDVIAQAALNSLMYDGITDYEAAKKEFQKDLGETPTGQLTVGQIRTLTFRSSRLNQPSVSFFSYKSGGSIHNDYALVQGTVTILDEKIAYPINHVKIDCFKTDGYCRYRQIVLTLPDEYAWVTSYHVMEMADDYYRITRWDTDQIDAVPAQNTACRTNQLSFNFATKEYFEIARNNTSKDCETVLGTSIPRLAKPRISQIVDGEEIIADVFRQKELEVRTYYSSAFRKKVEALNQAKQARTPAKN